MSWATPINVCGACEPAVKFRFRPAELVIGGGAEGLDARACTNLDLLQPSKRWPTDHCAVLCNVEIVRVAKTATASATAPSSPCNKGAV